MSESGLVIVDKSTGMTSHDVVARLRRLAGTRRVGHAGTLDPMATGVLVIGIERATRLLGHLALTEKDYAATLRLGQATVTDDADGEALPPAGGMNRLASSVSKEMLRPALAKLTGEIKQVPPRISAIKVNGQRAYHLTRSGAAPELAARTVTVYRLELLAVRPVGDLLDIDVEVTCSSGTYIRAIARDLGVALGTGGHLTALRRTRVGPYQIGAARTLDRLAEEFEFIPLAEAAAAAFPTLLLDAEEARLLSHGARLPVDGARWRTGAGGPARWIGAVADRPSVGAAGVGAVAGRSVADWAAGAESVADWAAGVGAPGVRAVADMSSAGRAAGVGAAADGAVGRGYRGVVPGRPVAAFGPDGTLIALVAEQDNEMRPITVFVP